MDEKDFRQLSDSEFKAALLSEGISIRPYDSHESIVNERYDFFDKEKMKATMASGVPLCCFPANRPSFLLQEWIFSL